VPRSRFRLGRGGEIAVFSEMLRVESMKRGRVFGARLRAYPLERSLRLAGTLDPLL
jgi:hypothetical protein